MPGSRSDDPLLDVDLADCPRDMKQAVREIWLDSRQTKIAVFGTTENPSVGLRSQLQSMAQEQEAIIEREKARAKLIVALGIACISALLATFGRWITGH